MVDKGDWYDIRVTCPPMWDPNATKFMLSQKELQVQFSEENTITVEFPKPVLYQQAMTPMPEGKTIRFRVMKKQPDSMVTHTQNIEGVCLQCGEPRANFMVTCTAQVTDPETGERRPCGSPPDPTYMKYFASDVVAAKDDPEALADAIFGKDPNKRDY